MLDLLGGKEKIKTQQHTNNIIFLLDVSNSMSTEDISENRLTQAKISSVIHFRSLAEVEWV